MTTNRSICVLFRSHTAIIIWLVFLQQALTGMGGRIADGNDQDDLHRRHKRYYNSAALVAGANKDRTGYSHMIAAMMVRKAPILKEIIRDLAADDIVVVDSNDNGFAKLLEYLGVPFQSTTYNKLLSANGSLSHCQLILAADKLPEWQWNAEGSKQKLKQLRRVLRNFTGQGGTLVATGMAWQLFNEGRVFSKRLSSHPYDSTFEGEVTESQNIPQDHCTCEDVVRNLSRSLPITQKFSQHTCKTLWTFPRYYMVHPKKRRISKVLLESDAQSAGNRTLMMCFCRKNTSGEIYYVAGPMIQPHEASDYSYSSISYTLPASMRKDLRRYLKNIYPKGSRTFLREWRKNILTAELNACSLKKAFLSSEIMLNVLKRHFTPMRQCARTRSERKPHNNY